MAAFQAQINPVQAEISQRLQLGNRFTENRTAVAVQADAVDPGQAVPDF